MSLIGMDQLLAKSFIPRLGQDWLKDRDKKGREYSSPGDWLFLT